MSQLAMDQITITDVTDGEKGVSVKIVTPFYTLGTVAPDKPTSNPPKSIWTTTEPEYIKGKNLYMTQRTVLEDSTFSYSDVSLDSSYKASEQAITTADTANATAGEAKKTAGEATKTAGEAKATSTEAKTIADKAASIANGANTAASNATQTAESANNTAVDASSVAKSALSTAQSAKQDTVTHYVPQYAQNTDPKTAPKTGWSEKAPDWIAGSYIWSRMIVAYGSGDYETTAPVVVTGNTGEPGKQGDPGKDGKDGTSVSIKGRVSTSSNLPPSASDGDGYITEDTGHLWVWGSHRFTDVGKIQGDNGLSAYAHKAYANSADGVTDFSTTNGSNRIYMGWYTDNTLADSNDPHKYTWTKVKGNDGTKGVSIDTVTPYWALGTVAPAQPSIPTPPSPWVSSEPGYQRNQNLYKTTKFTYDSGAFVYTNVQLDSSYQYSAAAETAARDALQTATNATTAADTAKKAAENANSAAASAMTKAETASSAATQAKATAATAAQSATSAQNAANLAMANARELIVNGDFSHGFTYWAQEQHSGVSISIDSDQRFVVSDTNTSMPDWVSYLTQDLAVAAISVDRTFRLEYDVICLRQASQKMYISAFDGENSYVDLSTLSTTQTTHFVYDFILHSGSPIKRIILGSYQGAGGSAAFDNISIRDITEAKAAQDAAKIAQDAAKTAQDAAKNAESIANAAQAAAKGAQTTADGKNKIFPANSEPTHTGLVPGDLWFQLNSSKQVTGIQMWNGSAFVDYVLMANEIIAAKSITGDKLDVRSVAAAIITSGLFQTASSGARVKMDSSGITGYNLTGAITFKIDAATGDVSMIGKFYSGDPSVSRVIIDDDYNKISNPEDVDVDGYVAFESHLSDESPIIGGMHGTPHGKEYKSAGMIITSGIADSSKPAGANLQLNSYEEGNASEGSLMATLHKMDAYHNIAVVDVNSNKNGQVALIRADGKDKGKYASVESRVDSDGNAYVAIVTNNIVQVDPVTEDTVEIYSSKHELTSQKRCVFNWENDWTGVSNIGPGYLEGTFNFTMSHGWYLVEAYIRTNGAGKEYHLDMIPKRTDGTVMDSWTMNLPMPSTGIGNMVCSQMVYVNDISVDLAAQLYTRDYGSRPEMFSGNDAKLSLFYPKRPLSRYFRIFAM